MKFLNKIFSKLISSEMNEYLAIVNAPDNGSIDRIKEVIKHMEKRYKFGIGGIMRTHYPEIQKLYVILGQKLEKENLAQEAMDSYKEAIELDGYPPLTKEAKKKLNALEKNS